MVLTHIHIAGCYHMPLALVVFPIFGDMTVLTHKIEMKAV